MFDNFVKDSAVEESQQSRQGKGERQDWTSQCMCREVWVVGGIKGLEAR